MTMTHRHEAGLVRPLDGVIHAVRNTVEGPMAVCGAGRIETQLVGRFDESSRTSCLVCIRTLSETSTSRQA